MCSQINFIAYFCIIISCKMKIKQIFTFILTVFISMATKADEVPTISPSAVFTASDGTEEETSSFEGSAPVVGKFYANVENQGDYAAHFEWRITKEQETEPYLVRREENMEYTFTVAGVHKIELYATFTRGTDVVEYTKEYWADANPITVSVSESKLEFPNAFSPNGDGINDVFKAKEGYKSIVEFHASIYNRWGQKLFEWSNPAEGWDGTYKGKDVKQGVYYVLVKAKGADGRKFNIRRDVNLLRGYTEETGNSGKD